MRKGRTEAWTAGGKEGREEASGGWIKRGREGAREGGKLQGRYPDEGTGQVHNREPGRNRATTSSILKESIDPYLWTELDPVVEGSGSRCRHLLSPTERYDRLPGLCRIRCTFRSSDYLLFVKNAFVVGARSLNITAGH